MKSAQRESWNDNFKQAPQFVEGARFHWKQLTECWFFLPAVMFLLPVGTFLVVYCLWSLCVKWPAWLEVSNPETAALYGDAHGSVNALFSGLAFAGVILTILLQTYELRLQRKEIDDSQKIWEEQAGLMLFATVLDSLAATKASHDDGDRQLVANDTFDFLADVMLRRAYELLPRMRVPKRDIARSQLETIFRLGKLYYNADADRFTEEHLKQLQPRFRRLRPMLDAVVGAKELGIQAEIERAELALQQLQQIRTEQKEVDALSSEWNAALVEFELALISALTILGRYQRGDDDNAVQR